MLTVRFSENEFYDINLDRDCVTLIATTSDGSFFAPFLPIDKKLPKLRKEFKARVIDLMNEGYVQGEVELEGIEIG